MGRVANAPGSNWLWLSIGGFLMLSLSFIAMPLVRALPGGKPVILPGLMFWLGLVLGITGQVALEQYRRRFFARRGVNRKRYQKPRCGALSFFSNKEAMIVDWALPFCIVGMVLSYILAHQIDNLCYLFTALTVFCFSMHCVLNGRNYLFVHNQNRVRQVLEQETIRNF